MHPTAISPQGIAPRERYVAVPRAIGGPSLAPFGAATRTMTLSGATMGTTWRVRAVTSSNGDSTDRDAIVARLDALVAALSNWAPDSALSCFNRAPLHAWQPLPEALLDVLLVARDVHARSAGAFDPTVAALVAAWGFGPRATPGPGRHAPPCDVELDAARRHQGFGAIEIDAIGRRARRTRDVTLDLCGIAKGHAVDRLSALLVDRDRPHHLVEIGGELRGAGVKADASPWWVGIEAPPDAEVDAVEHLVALHGLAIATSGDYRHAFVHDGRRHAHAVDPRTGRTVANAPASVAVLDRRCVVADAEATAIMVLGVEAGLAHADRHGLAALVAERVGRRVRFHRSAAFDAMLA